MIVFYRYRSPVPLSSANIREAFDTLSEELERFAERAEIIVVGGAAPVLLFWRPRDHERHRRVLRQTRKLLTFERPRSELPDDWDFQTIG
jgi:hypothetical protein